MGEGGVVVCVFGLGLKVDERDLGKASSGMADASVSAPSSEADGRREMYTLRKEMVDAPHLGTMADSKLLVSYR